MGIDTATREAKNKTITRETEIQPKNKLSTQINPYRGKNSESQQPTDGDNKFNTLQENGN